MKSQKQIYEEFNNYLTSALEKRWASYRLLRSKNQLDLSHLKCESTYPPEIDIAPLDK